MLHQHLRNVYAQQVKYYQQSSPEVTTEQENEVTKSHKHTNSMKNVQTAKNHGKSNENTVKVLPKEPKRKNRLKEMREIYGEMAPKIMGMETAIDLNFQHLKEERTYINWPNIPIKL